MSDGWAGECKAELSSCGLDKDGNLTLTFTVDSNDKYSILPISDIRGRAFQISISTASKRVFAGKDGIEAARQRRIDREAARDT